MKNIFILCIILPIEVFSQIFMDTLLNLPQNAIGGNTMDVVITDLNGDNFPDIILAKEWQRNRLLFNDGNGNFIDVSEGNFVKPRIRNRKKVYFSIRKSYCVAVEKNKV